MRDYSPLRTLSSAAPHPKLPARKSNPLSSQPSLALHPGTDWFAVFALFLAGLAGAMQFAKLSPVMDVVAQEFALSLVSAGLAVSMIGIVGVIFAISAGALVAAIGLKRGLLLALFGGAAVAIAGSFAPNGPVFLFSRVLEGFSHLLIVVCAPALMSAHASQRDRPIVLSIWGCFFGVGFAITSAVAPAVVGAAGWRGLMQSHAALLCVVGVLVALALGRSHHKDTRKALPTLRDIVATHAAVYHSGAPLLLALCFCAYACLFLAVLTFLGRFLNDAQHWSLARTGSFLAAVSFITLGFTLFAGWLVRRGVRVLAGLGTAFVAVALSAVGVFAMQPVEPWLIASIACLMAGFGLIPGFVFANVPSVAPTPARAALAYGAIAQFGNVGSFAGTPVFAAAYQAMGWPGGAVFVASVAFIGLWLAWLLHRHRPPSGQQPGGNG